MHARKGTLIRRLVLASLTILTVLSVAGWIATGGRRIRLWALATDCGELTAHEIRFLESMADILRRWAASPKQALWVEDLVHRLGGRVDG